MKDTEEMRVVALVGMHRSGTSSFAKQLHESGTVYMGKEFISPAPDNPKGFYEDRLFKEMNEKILKRAGGNWRKVPPYDEIMYVGQLMQPQMMEVYQEARENARKAGAKAWGWKDPRNCLTLDAWKYAGQIDQIIVVKRHSVDVIKSLIKRNGMTTSEACELWETYRKRIAQLEW